MIVDLIKYMSERLTKESIKGKEPGPVITISRQHGCPAKTIAKNVSEELSNKLIARGISGVTWRYVTKEIIRESARELDVTPSKIKYVFDYEQKGLIDDILAAQSSKYYKSDKKIRTTVGRVIRNMANVGNIVIVGRGGVAITRDIPHSLHIQLEAPLEWRILRTSEKYCVSLEEAEKITLDIDRKRKQFREYFGGKNSDYLWFDLTFNCMTMSVEEITKIIVKAVEVRNFI
jgi:cytidylate kinase